MNKKPKHKRRVLTEEKLGDIRLDLNIYLDNH
jgi:hypothetical protein